MHRCLEVLDILVLIFRGIQDDYIYHGESRSSLAHMAVTCRRFYDPAMNALWSWMVTIMPLVKCMGSDMIVLRPPRESIDLSEQGLPVRVIDLQYCLILTVNLQCLAREPSEAEWERMLKHAHRVRCLFLCSSEPSMPLSRTLLAAVSRFLYRTAQTRKISPFQQLSHIWCEVYMDIWCTWPCLSVLAGPTLSHVVLWEVPCDRLDIASDWKAALIPIDNLLVQLVHASPNIVHLQARGFPHDDKIFPSIIIQTLQRLVSFHLDQQPLSRELISVLSSICRLRELAIVLDDIEWQYNSTFAGFIAPFQMLTRLSIALSSPLSCIGFMESLPPTPLPQLTHLKFDFTEIDSTADLPELLSLVGRQKSLKHLAPQTLVDSNGRERPRS